MKEKRKEYGRPGAILLHPLLLLFILSLLRKECRKEERKEKRNEYNNKGALLLHLLSLLLLALLSERYTRSSFYSSFHS